MPIYILMTKLTPATLGDAAFRRGKGDSWIKRVNELCPEAVFIDHYALLGRYDFMDIYEAPDEATAHKVSLISRQEGALSAESWPAIPYDQHLELMEELDG